MTRSFIFQVAISWLPGIGLTRLCLWSQANTKKKSHHLSCLLFDVGVKLMWPRPITAASASTFICPICVRTGVISRLFFEMYVIAHIYRGPRGMQYPFFLSYHGKSAVEKVVSLCLRWRQFLKLASRHAPLLLRLEQWMVLQLIRLLMWWTIPWG